MKYITTVAILLILPLVAFSKPPTLLEGKIYQEDGDYRVEQEAIFDILKNTYLSRGFTIDDYKQLSIYKSVAWNILESKALALDRGKKNERT